VVWGPFVSASSSRLTLARPALAASLAGAARDLRLGSGLTANRINLPYASELYPAFNISSRFSSTSVLPLTLAHPPSQSCDQESDSLEPRDAIEKENGEVVTLVTTRRFRSVGEWYADFGQLTDADVLALLRPRAGD